MVRLLKVSTGICTLALGLGVAASPAAARRLPFKIATYKVVYKGSGSYSVNQSGGGGSFTRTSARFHWAVHYNLLFIDKPGEHVAGITGPLSVGAGDWSISSNNGGSESCVRSGGLELNKNGGISGAVQQSGKVIMRLTPGSNDYKTTDGSSGSQACDTTDFWHDWVENFSKVGSGGETIDPLTGFVTLSKQELNFGKIVVNVSNHTLAAPTLTVDPGCGGVSGGGASCHQSYDWKGTVTFTKTKIRSRKH
jgi:hypothetical protein